jgi:hypothetical protein
MKYALASGAAIALALGLAAAAQAQPDERPAPPHATAPAPARPEDQFGHGRYLGQEYRDTVGVRAGLVVNSPRGPYAAGPGAPRQFRPIDQGRVQFNARVYPPTLSIGARFQLAPRFYPTGWYYHRWAYGEYLPWGWFAPAFYLTWANYGLPAPPVGCEWVQQGSDAVLVDIWTGQVLSVVPSVFWW